MSFFLNSVIVPLKKNTMDMPSVRMGDAKVVTIPMQMHTGTPAKPVVKMGDMVKVGTLIAEANGEASSPVYASVSGKVTKVIDYLTAAGVAVPAVTITSDGEMAVCEELAAPAVNSKDDLLAAIRASGAVCSDAGCPAHTKFNVDLEKVEALIVNGIELEPYLTSETHAMLECASDIEVAIKAIQKHFGIKRIIIALSDNQKSVISPMKELASRVDGAEVKVLRSIYSQGSEEAIVYHTTGKVKTYKTSDVELGCPVCGASALAVIGKYLQSGMPMVERYVTVDGGCVKSPACVVAPIGVSVEELLAFCGELNGDVDKVVCGGPMTGTTVPNFSAPVLKTTSAVLALSAADTKFPKDTACIRCGKCTNECPIGLAPAAIAKAYASRDVEALTSLQIEACIGCGACSYVCPAHRPLVQTNKLAKALVKEEKAKEANN